MLEPRILESERQHVPAESKLKPEESQRKKTLDPQIIDTDRSIMTKEKQKKLVE